MIDIILWFGSGLVSISLLIFIMAIDEGKNHINISPIVVVRFVVGIILGLVTFVLCLIFGFIFLSESKEFTKWMKKPFKTIKFKKDE